MSKYSQLLERRHRVDEFCDAGKENVRRLAQLFGMESLPLSSPIGTSNLSHEQAKRYWHAHRDQLRRILDGATSSGAEHICIVGAGAGLDLDFEWLILNGFKDIVLLDLDRRGVYSALETLEAVLGRASREELGDDGAVELTFQADQPVRFYARPFDATLLLQGLSERESDYIPRMLTMVDRGDAPRHVFRIMTDYMREATLTDQWLERQQGFDVVLSDCVLSQMVSSVGTAMLLKASDILRKCHSSSFQAFVHVVLTMVENQVVQNHLRCLAQLCSSQGIVHVVADTQLVERKKFKSGQSFPDEYQVDSDDGETIIVQRQRPRLVTGDSLAANLHARVQSEHHKPLQDNGHWTWNRQPDELQQRASTFAEAAPYYFDQVEAVSFRPEYPT